MTDEYVCSHHHHHFVLFVFQSALGAAVVNIQIPILLGDVVNVLSRFTAETAGNFMDDIRQPAMKLVSMYGIQVRK